MSKGIRESTSLRNSIQFSVWYCIYALGSDIVHAQRTNSVAYHWGTIPTSAILIGNIVLLMIPNAIIFLTYLLCIRIVLAVGLIHRFLVLNGKTDAWKWREKGIMAATLLMSISWTLSHYKSIGLLSHLSNDQYVMTKKVVVAAYIIPLIYVINVPDIVGRFIFGAPKEPKSADGAAEKKDQGGGTSESVSASSVIIIVSLIVIAGLNLYVIYPRFVLDEMTDPNTFALINQLDLAGLILGRAFNEFFMLQARESIIKSFLPHLLYEKMLTKIADSDRTDGNISPSSLITTDTRECCVIFIDLVGSMDIAKKMSSAEYRALLHRIFSIMDSCALQGIQKVETIGDCYLAVSGIFDDCGGPASTRRACCFAVAIVDAMKSVYLSSGEPIRVRIGIDKGPVSHSITPGDGARWCIYGDAVNRASRLQTTSLPSRIQISASVHSELDSRFRCSERGIVEVKGMGDVQVFWLDAIN